MTKLTITNWEAQFQTETTALLAQLTALLNRYDHRKLNLLLLNQITIEYFESQTAIRYLVNVRKGAENDYFLEPFDHSLLKKIYTSLIQAPTNWQITLQSNQIRIAVPFLTTAKKAQLAKKLRDFGEATQINLRQLRQRFAQELKLLYPGKDLQFQALNTLQTAYQDAKLALQKVVKTRVEGLLVV